MRQRGFTLIEMVVMIIIIAVLSSVAVPRYYDFASKARFQESVQKVLSVFASARYKAIQTGADCIVRYDSQSGIFVVESEVSPPGEDQPLAMQEPLENAPVVGAEPVQIGDNLVVADFQVDNAQQGSLSDRSKTMEVHFYEDGRADGAVLLLQGLEGERAVIEITPLTGRAGLQEDEL